MYSVLNNFKDMKVQVGGNITPKPKVLSSSSEKALLEDKLENSEADETNNIPVNENLLTNTDGITPVVTENAMFYQSWDSFVNFQEDDFSKVTSLSFQADINNYETEYNIAKISDKCTDNFQQFNRKLIGYEINPEINGVLFHTSTDEHITINFQDDKAISGISQIK